MRVASKAESSGAVPGTPERTDERDILAEPRWPVALAILTFIAISVALRIALPNRESLGPHWLVPGIEFGLLVCLVASDPAHLAHRPHWLRRDPHARGLALA